MMSLWKLGNVLGGHFFFIASVTLALRVQLSSSETNLHRGLYGLWGIQVSHVWTQMFFTYRIQKTLQFQPVCLYSALFSIQNCIYNEKIFIHPEYQFILAIDALKVYSQLMEDHAIMTKFLVGTIIKFYSKLVQKEEFDDIIKCTQPKF